MAKLFLLIVSFAITFISEEIFQIANWSFYIYITFVTFDFIQTKSITLIQIWIFAFVYIILAEILIFEGGNSTLNLLSVRLIIVSNNSVLLGYIFGSHNRKNRIGTFKLIQGDILNYKRGNYGLISLFTLLIIYLVYFLPIALKAFYSGRDVSYGVEDTSFAWSAILSSIGFVLPAIAVFYFKRIKRLNSFYAFLFSLPIFILLFINGTRFPLLFSLIGFFAVNGSLKFHNITFKSLMPGIIILLMFLGLNELMKINRVSGFSNFQENQRIEIDQKNDIFSIQVAEEMGNEGVFDMTRVIINYFDSNPHTLGASTAFITYFWVPRSIWPEKPTMIGHWLVRESRDGFGAGHSASFGFFGELYADFGWFCVLFLFLIGVLLYRLEIYRSLVNINSFQFVFCSMLIPYVFLFLRSPVTSTMSFIGIYVVYFFFKRILFTKKY